MFKVGDLVVAKESDEYACIRFGKTPLTVRQWVDNGIDILVYFDNHSGGYFAKRFRKIESKGELNEIDQIGYKYKDSRSY